MTVPMLSTRTQSLYHANSCDTDSDASSSTINDVLPCEVLANIFDFLSFDDLLLASKVCSFWRDTAISNPRLWAQLFDAPLSALPELIRRAQAVPVSLNVIRITPTNFPRICHCVAQHLALLGHLGLYFDHAVEFEAEDMNSDYSTWDWNMLWNALHRPAPQLTSFSLTSENGEFVTFLPSSRDCTPFSDGAPRLQRLTLDGFEMEASTPAFEHVEQFTGNAYALAPFQPLEAYFPSLTELTLYDIGAMPIPPLSSSLNLRALILHFRQDADSMDDWRDVITWLRDSGVQHIPYLEIFHEDIEVQRFVLQSVYRTPRRLSIEDVFDDEFSLALDCDAGFVRVVPTISAKQAKAHLLAAATFCKRISTLFCSATPAALKILPLLDSGTLSDIEVLELELDISQDTDEVYPRSFLENMLPMRGVKTLVLSAAVTTLCDIPESPTPKSVTQFQAANVLEFATRITPNVEGVQVLDVPLAHAELLHARFRHFHYQPPL
ncbi:hypothetical protein EXIGLDRAFT_701405 [Exidia glandulosa HHB12029]|uniref:F-box domain-containing protein n=1 Tax=Exidia glandulosa HHB12029 TaxID=1314781 RepID=A0A165LUB4_EXIGL|nr:hypothetical protein EXIGLDRAFT_701405 [Exidia glandulosa HHB12029]